MTASTTRKDALNTSNFPIQNKINIDMNDNDRSGRNNNDDDGGGSYNYDDEEEEEDENDDDVEELCKVL